MGRHGQYDGLVWSAWTGCDDPALDNKGVLILQESEPDEAYLLEAQQDL